ncbi:hypothetical protein C8F04DRAFT_1185612 [Mycena alexandri]|uniref:Uncharacterized protein n=1 Tax=Mycena alexandri TaxID=1745969 RepID=A0AAD6SQA9_9AGAR|nr:hypothetical protein C8F04DRAFT_1185612 [Mycena alexandri]
MLRVQGLRVQGAPRTRPRINRAHRGFDRADRKTWYKTTVPLTEPWSCDWENWDNASYFLHPYSGLSPEAIYLTWCIPGHIYPLAFLPGRVMPEPTYVFVADGRYYWAQYGRLKRIEGPFASDDDFLRRLGEDEWINSRCPHRLSPKQPGVPTSIDARFLAAIDPPQHLVVRKATGSSVEEYLQVFIGFAISIARSQRPVLLPTRNLQPKSVWD